MTTTQAGVPIIDCTVCGVTHPEPRRHCANCGRNTLFINQAGHCLTCAAERPPKWAGNIATQHRKKKG